MTTNSESIHYGFKEFYFDNAYFGHGLVEPNIVVFEAFGHIFSPIQEQGCFSKSCEVVERAAFFALTSIAAIFTLLLAALGLLVKSISYCASQPKNNEDLFQPDSTPDNIEETHTEARDITPVQTSIHEEKSPPPAIQPPIKEEMPPEPKLTYSESTSKEELEITPEQHVLIGKAKKILFEVKENLQKIQQSAISGEAHILAVEQALQQHYAMIFGPLCCSLPVIKEEHSKNELEITVEEYEATVTWIESLKKQFLFQVSREEHPYGPVNPNGDCLFETFIHLGRVNQNLYNFNFEEQVNLNGAWILEHIDSDKKLQEHVCNAMAKFYNMPKPPSPQQIKDRLSDFLRYRAEATVKSQAFSFAFELYALSSRNKLTLAVYSADRPEVKPHIFNEQWQKNGVLSFKLQHNLLYPYPAHDERIKVVNWMQMSYQKDPELLLRLIDSIEGHFLGEIQKLDDEKQGLAAMELSEAVPKGSTKKRSDEIDQTIKACEDNVLAQLSFARGAKATSKTAEVPLSYKPIEKLILQYLEKMSHPTIFGGAAELRALSQIHQVRIVTHGGNPDFDFIPESGYKKVYHFKLKNGHYTPHFPDQENA